MIALQFNPALGWADAVALGAVFVLLGWWLAARALAPAIPQRGTLLLLRVGGLCLVTLVWLNPGKWVEPPQDADREWLVLLDRSASMKAAQRDATTRWEAGTVLAQKLAAKTNPGGARVKVRTFSSQLEGETNDPLLLAPDGNGSNLADAVTAALDQRSTPVAGLVLISDGRVTTRADIATLALRARGRGIPIHSIPLGGEAGLRDLSLVAMPRQVTAFKDQPLKLTALVENQGLGMIKPAIRLLDADGKELQRKDIALRDGAREAVTFEVASAPATGAEFQLETDLWPGEQVPANNRDSAKINLLTSKTRVLLLEGAPYWDSKFLAQLLRQQNAVDILTVHRLNEERYFRVEASGAEPLQSPDTVFPKTAAELARYDLIVFGKGADGFLDPARIAAVQGFVREQGGAVLFARGKPYSGQFHALEALEPVEWGEDTGISARFVPVADHSFGLFGAALPAADDRLWSSLPPLDDLRNIARLKPFTRVLAEGQVEGRQAKTPLLLVRRYGRGMVAAVNADGLWRWDFRPELRERGAIYQQFWVQLMQWCATYSEFRPGEDYAVRLAESLAEPGRGVRATVAWRGPAAPEPQPTLRIYQKGKQVGEALATPLPAPAGGGREWAAVVTVTEPGSYEVRVADPKRPGKLEGEARLQVMRPIEESDDLRPDSETLRRLAQESGGNIWKPDQLDELLQIMNKNESAAIQGKPKWEPIWPQWWMALAITLCFGSEWWLRRRGGLL